MLAFRKDTGCSGLLEPEAAIRVMEAVMIEGLLGLFWDVPTLNMETIMVVGSLS